ncbi:MAG: signal recognition particle-docking protein FtsY, partial [Acidimicrobiales bacterium]
PYTVITTPPPRGVATATEEQAGGDTMVVERATLQSSLGRSRGVLGQAFGRLRARRTLGEEFWQGVEEALIVSDVGLGVTERVVNQSRQRVRQNGVVEVDDAIRTVREVMVESFLATPRDIIVGPTAPSVILFVGVNGVGKTTSIGKVAARLANQGEKVVVAAGDTFRAAAAEQLERWAERASVEIVAGESGGDPAAVIFDAISHAKAAGATVVLADTAGRLQNRFNLMEELKKIRRVAEKAEGTITDVLLVLDATTGQNGLVQAEGFSAAAGVTGVILTKMDGSAKGGIAFAIESELGIPIKAVGVGESIEDLVDFDPSAFVHALTYDAGAEA